ncbi:hypothetical protein L226DRAFT_332261 [Lentinus tigrinus ALCF2SS1-7]|uniref:Uncharacterized protein n=1 Tax=Lentinus tigrinus ALCF2SS1-6 TaxID=1328759 RepID=A0A5C2SGU5_9APHY|nr:hypothetical protein L227DRAFT_544977 [Lentinus tigrinus ALCF2SS1-6]RPD77801.1 hypothetical protein L226DRAFT_332261 [Lentinus tigrinus ALCF2SS1-7]
MDRLCDEILQLILNELNDPAAFSMLSKRHQEFTKDPYVRAMYFLTRYGRIQALYWALGRGKLLSERMLDILLGSGAHLSRYLVQLAMHHYFRTQVTFIKARWVRTLTFPVFAHFLAIAARMYGNIPAGKGEDDGNILSLYLKQSRFPTEYRAASWEQVRDVVEKYKFIPFSDKDPMMAQFPLVLAIEPRLLPYARLNGFSMDRKYRNFVFRRMFEKPAIMFESRTTEIIKNVRELSRLDPDMFLSRTVAAEICMEAKTNELAYTALKRLDKEGVLRFELSSVVHDLIKLFQNTRSVTTLHTAEVLRILHKDFPSEDPTIRLVLLLTIFFVNPCLVPVSLEFNSKTSAALLRYVENCSDKINDLNLGPLTRKDITEILLSKFVPERFGGILQYARSIMQLSPREMRGVLTDVALACLEIGCKGKMLAKLVETYDYLEDIIATHIVKNYRIQVEDLPPPEDEAACKTYTAPLCADILMRRGLPLTFEEATAGSSAPAAQPAQAQADDTEAMLVDPAQSPDGDAEEHTEHADGAEDEEDEGAEEPEAAAEAEEEDLGAIGQDTLSAMIRKDELVPSRRRRYQVHYYIHQDNLGNSPYPSEYTQVGKWLQEHYGQYSAVAAVVRLHAVINQNPEIVNPHMLIMQRPLPVRLPAPTTLKHFKLLARLGRAPSIWLYDDIETGMEFYFSEEDYLTPEELSGASHSKSSVNRSRRARQVVKSETSPTPGPSTAGPSRLADSSSSPASGSSSKKRPRRSVATSVKSYVIPDSDDEDIAVEGEDESLRRFVKKKKAETNMQRWIKQLDVLLKEEQRKYNDRKRRIHASTPPGVKVKVLKTEFHKSLAFNLPRLRRIDRDKREKLYGADVPDEDCSESDADEYQYRTTRSKRRKVEF